MYHEYYYEMKITILTNPRRIIEIYWYCLTLVIGVETMNKEGNNRPFVFFLCK